MKSVPHATRRPDPRLRGFPGRTETSTPDDPTADKQKTGSQPGGLAPQKDGSERCGAHGTPGANTSKRKNG